MLVALLYRSKPDAMSKGANSATPLASTAITLHIIIPVPAMAILHLWVSWRRGSHSYPYHQCDENGDDQEDEQHRKHAPSNRTLVDGVGTLI